MIKSLLADNFKSLVDFRVDFNSTSILIGNNSTGKSTILQAIQFVLDSVKEDFSVFLERRNWRVENIKSKLIKKNRMHFSLEIELADNNQKFNYIWELSLNLFIEKNKIVLQEEKLQCNDQYLIRYNPKEFYIKTKNNEEVTPNFLTFESSTLKYLNGRADLSAEIQLFMDFVVNSFSFELLSPDEMRMSSRGIKDTIGVSGRDLPSFIKSMDEKQKQKYLADIHELFGDTLLAVGAKTKGKPGWTQIEVTEQYNGKKVMINSKEMSDGMLRLLAFLAVGEMQGKNTVMLFDEIENGINICHAEKLMQVFFDMFENQHRQLIITTHSTVFLDYVSVPECLIYIYRDSIGATRALPLYENPVIQEKLQYMYPGEVLLNLSQQELNQILSDEGGADH